MYKSITYTYEIIGFWARSIGSIAYLIRSMLLKILIQYSQKRPYIGSSALVKLHTLYVS